MQKNKEPTYGNGKICYLEIPTADINKAADFYQSVFGWHIRKRKDGTTAFDDSVGEVSGSWVSGRTPATQIGMLVHIMVDNMATTLDLLVSKGGSIVQPVGADAPEITARFSDPDGNIFGLYQQPG